MMLALEGIHHIAIICSNYEKSKYFYTEILGLKILKETFREKRNSYKLDLAINGQYIIELFSFPDYAQRPSRPEATGLRHLAFRVADIEKNIKILQQHNIVVEPVRVDELTGKKFTFFADPDDLPIELYEE